jgi:TRAP-type transport system small permease protein
MSVPSGHSEGSADPPEHGSRVVRFLARASFVAGATGLLATMAIEAVAVLGRHVGLPVLGSIELVQAAVVLMGSSALVGTTLRDRHASVHLLTERLAPRPRDRMRRVAYAASALFFAFLLIGSLILVHDLWNGDERSELLGLPYAPLRLLFVASIALIVVLFLGSALARRPDRADHVG